MTGLGLVLDLGGLDLGLELDNKLRVKRHRSRVKKKLLEPLIIENNEKKSEYELLRERNIEEFERKKKESGLFD